MTAAELIHYLTHEAVKSDQPDENTSSLAQMLYDAASGVFAATPAGQVSEHAQELRRLASFVDGIYLVGADEA